MPSDVLQDEETLRARVKAKLRLKQKQAELKAKFGSDLVPAGEVFGRSVVQGLTSNLADEAGILDEQRTAAGVEQRPVIAAAGEVVGSVGQGLALPAKRVVDVVTGAVEGFGAGKGVKGKLLGAAGGAAAGLVLGAAGKKAAKLASKLRGAKKGTKEFFETVEQRADLESLGMNRQGVLKKLGKGKKSPGEAEAAKHAKVLREEGLFKDGTDPKDMLKRLDDIDRQAKEASTRIAVEVDKAFPQGVDAKRLQETLVDNVLRPLERNPRTNREQINAVIRVIEDISDLSQREGKYLFSDLDVLRQQLGEIGFRGGSGPAAIANQNMWKAVRTFTDDIVEELGPDQKTALKRANQVMTAVRRAEQPLKDRASREVTSTSLPRSIPEAAQSLVTPSPTSRRELAQLGRKVTGSKPIQTLVMDNIERFGKAAPIIRQAASRGPRALTATLYSLEQQDAAVRREMRKLRGQK